MVCQARANRRHIAKCRVTLKKIGRGHEDCDCVTVIFQLAQTICLFIAGLCAFEREAGHQPFVSRCKFIRDVVARLGDDA